MDSSGLSIVRNVVSGHLKRYSVFLDISCKASTTGFSSGIPSLIRIASASHSGSPGISGPLAGGGFGVAKHLNPVDLFLELVFVDEALDPQGAEKVADAFADTARGDFTWRIGQ